MASLLRLQVTRPLPCADSAEVILEIKGMKEKSHHAAQAQIDWLDRVVVLDQRITHAEDPDEMQRRTSQEQQVEQECGTNAVRAAAGGYSEDKNKSSDLGSDAQENEHQAVVLRFDFLHESDFNEKPNKLENSAEQGDHQHDHPIEIRWHGAGPSISRHSRVVNRRWAVHNTRSRGGSRDACVSLRWGNSRHRRRWNDGSARCDLRDGHPLGHAFTARKVGQDYTALGQTTL